MSQDHQFNKNSDMESVQNKRKRSQDQQLNKNSEYESEFESDYEDRENETECEISSEGEGDSDYGNEKNAKRRKIVDQPLLIDEKGHIKWYPRQQLGGFQIVSALGEGAFGRVLRVKNLNTGRQAALKVIKNTESKRKAAMVELIALTIIKCRDTSDTNFCIKMLNWFDCSGHICIAFPLLGVNVFDFLKDNDFEPFNIDEVRHISYQLCSAVAFLHKNGMTHTDLKTENMLFVDSSYTTVFDEESESQIRRLHRTDIRLSDFGGVVRSDEYHPAVISTRYYRAPEVILRLGWNESCDIWAIGCILIELYTGELLFPTHEDREHLAMMERILGVMPAQMVNATNAIYFKKGKLVWNWNDAEKDVIDHCAKLKDFQWDDDKESDKLFDLIGQMLHCEPSRRITISNALAEPFFEKLSPNQHCTNNNNK